jgi:hypothetical protein
MRRSSPYFTRLVEYCYDFAHGLAVIGTLEDEPNCFAHYLMKVSHSWRTLCTLVHEVKEEVSTFGGYRWLATSFFYFLTCLMSLLCERAL